MSIKQQTTVLSLLVVCLAITIYSCSDSVMNSNQEEVSQQEQGIKKVPLSE